jgi:chemotaxis protein MotA
MELMTALGLLIGFVAIGMGHVFEGGHIGSLLQLTAGFIVFGGTLGAVLVSHSRAHLQLSIRLLKEAVFSSRRVSGQQLAKEIVDAAVIARKESILALDRRLNDFSDPYMKSVFRYVVDGIDPSTIKEMFEKEIDIEERRLMSGSKVFMDAGGFAPTIGIIGAVLGLIHVMENLTDTSKLGSGIAVAFVATIYGVGSANLVFIPIANKLKSYVIEQSRNKELVLTGALGVINGLNPIIIEEMLRPYYGDRPERRTRDA